MSKELDASVIVPSYNRRQALGLTLASLRWQTHAADRFEVLIVEDGSTDGTADWLASISLPQNVTVIRQANGGRSAARNTGLRRYHCPVSTPVRIVVLIANTHAVLPPANHAPH